MPQFVATYVQLATQTITAADIHAAGALAQQYIRDHAGLVLHSIVVDPVAPPAAT